MEHPTIKHIEQWGYPKYTGHEYVMMDSLSNEIYTGDEYFDLDGELYLINSLSSDAIKILELHGATRLVAK